jgi:hypothetical protein
MMSENPRDALSLLFSPPRLYSPCSSGSCMVCWLPHTFRSQPALRCTAQRLGDFGQRRLPGWRSAVWSSVGWLWCVPSVRSGTAGDAEPSSPCWRDQSAPSMARWCWPSQPAAPAPAMELSAAQRPWCWD